MNGLPAAADLSPMVGATVLQLCFGEFQMVINCDRAIRIAVESQCQYRDPHQVETVIESYRTAAAPLCGVIGQVIVHARRQSDGGLSLKFANGSALEIRNNNSSYESVQLHLGDDIFVA